HYVPEKAHLVVREGQSVSAGTVLAIRARDFGSSREVTTGLPQFAALLEARGPEDPGALAEATGIVQLGASRAGKRLVRIQRPDEQGRLAGAVHEQWVPSSRPPGVLDGKYVRRGDLLVPGPLDPHHLLCVLGRWAVQDQLLAQLQECYRRNRINVDDRHFEV